MRSPEVPHNAEKVTTFKAYRAIVEAFYSGMFNLLILIGLPGLSKSYEFQRRIKSENSFLLKGQATPYYTYKELWYHRDEQVIIDDGELLWKERQGRILLRSLTEAMDEKEVFWAAANKEMERLKIPPRFKTKSKVALICNRFVFGDADEYEAISDRAHLVYFAPTPIEIHRNVARWFWDQQIHDYIGSRLHVMKNLSSRTYVKIYERKMAGLGDWRRVVDEVYCYDSSMALVQELEASKHSKTKRIEIFTKDTGMSQSTYYNYAARLAEQKQLAKPPKPMKVKGKRPVKAGR